LPTFSLVLTEGITTMTNIIIQFFKITSILSSQSKISCFHDGEDSYCGFLIYDTVMSDLWLLIL